MVSPLLWVVSFAQALLFVSVELLPLPRALIAPSRPEAGTWAPISWSGIWFWQALTGTSLLATFRMLSPLNPAGPLEPEPDGSDHDGVFGSEVGAVVMLVGSVSLEVLPQLSLLFDVVLLSLLPRLSRAVMVCSGTWAPAPWIGIWFWQAFTGTWLPLRSRMLSPLKPVGLPPRVAALATGAPRTTSAAVVTAAAKMRFFPDILCVPPTNIC